MIGDKIKKLRNNAGILQQELADELNVSKAAVGMWETGKRTPDLDMIKKIANFFKVSTDWLTGNSKYRNENEVIECNWGYSDEYFTPAFDFCGLLKEIREEQDVSITDMANAIGLDPKQYEECEDGMIPITEQQAKKLCEYLGTDISQVLFDNEFYPEYVPEEYHSNVSEWEKQKAEADAEAEREAAIENSEDIKIVARHLEDIPKDKREELIKTINSTIDLYKKAIGYNKNGG